MRKAQRQKDNSCHNIAPIPPSVGRALLHVVVSYREILSDVAAKRMRHPRAVSPFVSQKHAVVVIRIIRDQQYTSMKRPQRSRQDRMECCSVVGIEKRCSFRTITLVVRSFRSCVTQYKRSACPAGPNIGYICSHVCFCCCTPPRRLENLHATHCDLSTVLGKGQVLILQGLSTSTTRYGV